MSLSELLYNFSISLSPVSDSIAIFSNSSGVTVLISSLTIDGSSGGVCSFSGAVESAISASSDFSSFSIALLSLSVCFDSSIRAFSALFSVLLSASFCSDSSSDSFFSSFSSSA